MELLLISLLCMSLMFVLITVFEKKLSDKIKLMLLVVLDMITIVSLGLVSIHLIGGLLK